MRLRHQSLFLKFCTILCLGFGSVLFLGAAQWSKASAYESQFYSWTFTLGSLLALLLYQPHFVATYQLAYGKERYRSHKHFFSYWALPAILICLFLFVAASETVFHLNLELSFIQTLFGITILFGLDHFSAQAVAATLRYSNAYVSRRDRCFLRALFFVTAVNGVLQYASSTYGSYPFFGFRVPVPELSLQVRLFLMNLLFGIHVLLMIYAIRKKWRLTGLIPWVAFLCWYLSPIFTGRYFYLIPVFHALQFLPFYFEAQKGTSLLKHGAIAVGVSLILVFIVPNLFLENFTSESLTRPLLSFAVILMALNLHHFALERVIWSKSA